MTYAKKLIVPTVCVLLGCAGGAAMGSVVAQTTTPTVAVRRWQHECVEVDYSRRHPAEETNNAIRTRGDAGWELVTAAQASTYSIYCFKRPAP